MIFHNQVPNLTSCILVIGTFDGVHKGHQYLISEARKKAKKQNVPLVVYTFSIPPKVYFQKTIQLCSLEEKINRLKKLGVDQIVVAHFNETYMKKTKDEFIEEIKKLQPLTIYIGSNFRFGAGRKGEILDLQRVFDVNVSEIQVSADGEAISSSRIRNLINFKQFIMAENLLGWTYEKGGLHDYEIRA